MISEINLSSGMNILPLRGIPFLYEKYNGKLYISKPMFKVKVKGETITTVNIVTI